MLLISYGVDKELQCILDGLCKTMAALGDASKTCSYGRHKDTYGLTRLLSLVFYSPTCLKMEDSVPGAVWVTWHDGGKVWEKYFHILSHAHTHTHTHNQTHRWHKHTVSVRQENSRFTEYNFLTLAPSSCPSFSSWLRTAQTVTTTTAPLNSHWQGACFHHTISHSANPPSI